MRWAFALWPADESTAQSICRDIGREYAPNAIVQGGVVKANGPARRQVRTYSRRPDGLLNDVTLSAGRGTDKDEIINALVSEIARAAATGSPFTHTGAAGIYSQRERLPAFLRALSRHRLEAFVQTALNDRRVMKCVGPNSTVPRYLDVPGGQFARGEAAVSKGAAT